MSDSKKSSTPPREEEDCAICKALGQRIEDDGTITELDKK